MTDAAALAQVRACLRWDAAGDDALRALDAAGWRAVLDTIRQRDGQALLARRLRRLPALPVPEEVTEELQRFRMEVATRTLVGLARLGPAIAAAGVPVMALKGLDLGTRLYGDLAARPMGDMDILVQPAHVGAMAEALSAQGFRASQAAQQPSHHLIFHAPQPGALPVELHWALGADEGHKSHQPLLGGIWDDAVPLDVSGVPLLVMSRQRLLPYLCAHLENHLFETPLTHIWDIAELLAQDGSAFDEAGFWATCDRHGRRRAAQVALALVSTSLAVSTPAAPLPANVLTLLPDVVPNLGHHPRRDAREPSSARLRLTDPAAPWRERWRILRAIILPSRPRRTAGGRAGYIRLWRTLVSNYLHHRRVRGDAPPEVRANIARRGRLGQWLG